ncbi:MAG: response regulator [Euryarchaeota archaeon]|nr:response regulator [Euryarchaeota archaeon]MDE1837295.1 response regulator [Euryarchaeota archaeon]MDE1879833.1 response regulator [Euryarchaeota archaeon]MDE2045274.1 response regulator [Thermoplasmata archaeon]
MATGEAVEVLLVEDDPDQVRLLKALSRKCSVPVRLQVATNGVEALELLRGTPGPSAPLRTQLVLLDLDLPELDGRAVLTEIRSDPRLARTPVVIVSASRQTSDVQHAYHHRANGYLHKPIVVEDLDALLLQVLTRAKRWA